MLGKPTGAPKNQPERPIHVNYDVLTRFTPFGDVLRHFGKIENFRILVALAPRQLVAWHLVGQPRGPGGDPGQTAESQVDRAEMQGGLPIVRLVVRDRCICVLSHLI